MKYSYGLIALFMSGLIFTQSCENALDADAEGNISGDVYESDANIKAALNGAYYSLGGIFDGVDGGELFGGDFMIFPSLFVAQNASEVSWDRALAPQYADFLDNNVVNTNIRIQSNWRRSYEVINLLNNIILNIDNVTSEKDRVHGEALAMRGMLYFEMVRLWGPEYDATTLNDPSIPLLISPIETVNDITTPTLATVSEVYNRIETDLNQASTLLQSEGVNGTNLSYYACQALLMRIALHKDEFGLAEGYADNILGTTDFDLENTPMEAFNNFDNSSEDIFAIQQTIANNAGDITSGTGITNYYASLSGKGIGAMRILSGALTTKSASLINGPRFSAIDLRGMRDTGTNTGSTPESVTAAFYTHIVSTSLYSSSKYMSADRVIPVIRLAEIYLGRSEAILRQTNTISQEAVDDLNEIRVRAGLTALQTGDFADADALLDSIKQEKRREFLYEGIIFHDLKRWGDSIGNPPAPATDDKFILPIPQSETDTWK